MRGIAVGGFGLGVVLAACQGLGGFVCTSDADCDDGGAAGRCETTGFCSFPDDGCPSMQRYGKHAGDLSGQCVAQGDETTAVSGTGMTSPTGGEPTSGGTGTDDVGVDDGLDDSTDSSDDATTQGQPDPNLEFLDDDEEDFGAGVQEGVAWVDGGVQVVDESAGTLTSRVFDALDGVQWRTLSWIPRGPYGKPLPGDGQSERGYARGNADMSANVLLLHLDGVGQADPGDSLPDRSGQELDFTLAGNAGVPWVAGRFGTALADDMDSYAYNDRWGDAFAFGEDDFTWSMWARSSTPCDGPDVSDNQVYLGLEGEGTNRSHLWLGCRHPTSTACPAGGGTEGRLGGTYSANHVIGGARTCGPTELVDDQWHHLVVVKSGHQSARVTLYFDGRVEDDEEWQYGDPIDFPAGTEMVLGAFAGGSFPAAATLDEVAIWRRALSGEEIDALYHRGMQRLQVRVRACDDPECETGGEFVGPDGTPQTAFEDLADALGPGTEQSLPPGLLGRYFQYQVHFEAGAGSPVLEQVVVRADPL